MTARKKVLGMGTVSFVIPAYNEAGMLPEVIAGIKRHPEFTKGMHIVVINDGSNDDTTKAMQKIKDVVVLEHIVNLGAGGATRTGLAEARELDSDYAITLDADGQHKVEDAFKLLHVAHKRKVDLLIGSRLIDRRGMPTNKVVGNILLNATSFMLLGIQVSDSQSGLRVFSRRTLESLSYYSNGYAFCSEMIWRAKKLGLKIEESPISAVYTTYSKTKMKRQKNVAGFFAIVSSLAKHRLYGLMNE